MRLIINNFAKIRNADIELNGITVIAGENNTGKSTVGKIVFSMFNSLVDFNDKIEKQREKQLTSIYKRIFENLNWSRAMILRQSRLLSHNVINFLSENEVLLEADFKKIFVECFDISKMREFLQDDLTKYLYTKTLEIINLSTDQLTKEYVSVYFKSVFHNQMNSINTKNQKASIKMNIKDSDVYLEFNKNNCDLFHSDIEIMHKAIYIDNPFVIDRISQHAYEIYDRVELSLVELLSQSKKLDLLDNVIGSVLAKNKMSDLFEKLESIISGDIIQSNDALYLKKDGIDEPIHLSNLSAGLKSFTIIKMLIEQGVIKEKDVLILDEPEIHLHPQWQIIYAEIIVLLQKYFDLTIIVTTHSQYFLDAIDLFSKEHNVEENVNFYLSEVKDYEVFMENVNENIDSIYKKMASQ